MLIAGLLASVAGSHAYAQPVGFPTRQILRTDLQGVSGQEVMLFTTDWAPGQRLPWHIHPDGHEFAYLIEGELTFEIEGVGERVVRAGEVNHVLPYVAHYGRNASNKLAKTLVIRIKDKSKPVMTEVSAPSGLPAQKTP